MSLEESWKITTVDRLITKIQKSKNAYVAKMIPIWLLKSETYAQMMIEKYGYSPESYWHLKTLFMYNKIFPSLKHDFKAPTWLPNEHTLEEWNTENLRATYENSQIFGVEYTEEAFRKLEAAFTHSA